MDIFWICGLFFCTTSYLQYAIDLKFLGLAILMCILQGSAIHGIYNKYLGLIIFNCVFKYLYILLSFGLFIIASYGYMTINSSHSNSFHLYEKKIPLSFFGILYYGFQAYLLVEIACLLHTNMRENSKYLPYYHT